MARGNEYPLRATIIRKRVCPPDPCTGQFDPHGTAEDHGMKKLDHSSNHNEPNTISDGKSFFPDGTHKHVPNPITGKFEPAKSGNDSEMKTLDKGDRHVYNNVSDGNTPWSGGKSQHTLDPHTQKFNPDQAKGDSGHKTLKPNAHKAHDDVSDSNSSWPSGKAEHPPDPCTRQFKSNKAKGDSRMRKLERNDRQKAYNETSDSNSSWISGKGRHPHTRQFDPRRAKGDSKPKTADGKDSQDHDVSDSSSSCYCDVPKQTPFQSKHVRPKAPGEGGDAKHRQAGRSRELETQDDRTIRDSSDLDTSTSVYKDPVARSIIAPHAAAAIITSVTASENRGKQKWTLQERMTKVSCFQKSSRKVRLSPEQNRIFDKLREKLAAAKAEGKFIEERRQQDSRDASLTEKDRSVTFRTDTSFESDTRDLDKQRQCECDIKPPYEGRTHDEKCDCSVQSLSSVDRQSHENDQEPRFRSNIGTVEQQKGDYQEGRQGSHQDSDLKSHDGDRENMGKQTIPQTDKRTTLPGKEGDTKSKHHVKSELTGSPSCIQRYKVCTWNFIMSVLRLVCFAPLAAVAFWQRVSPLPEQKSKESIRVTYEESIMEKDWPKRGWAGSKKPREIVAEVWPQNSLSLKPNETTREDRPVKGLPLKPPGENIQDRPKETQLQRPHGNIREEKDFAKKSLSPSKKSLSINTDVDAIEVPLIPPS